MSTKQVNFNQYDLTLLSVSMKIKFPCRMKLQHENNALTQQMKITQQQCKFQQQVDIKEDADKCLEIKAMLITDKGAKYVAGVVRLEHQFVKNKVGEVIRINMVKCLDNQAFCQIKVNKIVTNKPEKKISVSSSLLDSKLAIDSRNVTESRNVNNSHENNSHEKQVSPIQQSVLVSPRVPKSQAIQTRSQQNFFLHPPVQWQQTRSKGPAQTLIYKSSLLKSPKSKKPHLISPRQIPQFPSSSQPNLLTQSSVYKQGYQKLKEKYKQQCQQHKGEQTKRLLLETNQNTYKIQIIRLKIKTEELEHQLKITKDKNKEAQQVILLLEKDSSDTAYLKQQNNNLIQKISQLNQQLRTIKKDAQEWKKTHIQRGKNDQYTIHQVRLQLQCVKQEMQSLNIDNSQRQKQKQNKITSLQTQLKSQKQLNQTQTNQIYKLQSYIKDKIYEFEKNLQNQKNQAHELINGFNQKIQLEDREKRNLFKEIQDHKTQKQKLRAIILKAEYDKKVLVQDQKQLKTQLLQLKVIKQKYHSLQTQFSLLQQDNHQLLAQLQSLHQSQTLNLTQHNLQSQTTIKHYKSVCDRLQTEIKQLQLGKLDLDGINDGFKVNRDRQKRQIEQIERDNKQLRTELQQIKVERHLADEKSLTLLNQNSILTNSVKYHQQLIRIQSQRYKTDYQKARHSLRIQDEKNLALKQAKQLLQIQLSKTKIELQYSNQKVDKYLSSNRQLQQNLQNMIKENESYILDLQKSINSIQSSLKAQCQKTHILQLQIISSTESLQKHKKQLKLNQQRLNNLENQLKTSTNQLSIKESRIKKDQEIISKLEADGTAQKHQSSLINTEKHKLQKMLALRAEQLHKEKEENSKLNETKQKLQKTQSQLRDELKKSNQNVTKVQIKLKSSQRQYIKFKQVIQRTIKTQFGQSSTKDKQQNQTSLGKISQVLQKGQMLSQSSILSLLIQNISHQKSSCNSLSNLNKLLASQLQTLKSSLCSSIQTHTTSQLQLHKDIHQLNQQLNQMYEMKQNQIRQFQNIIQTLTLRITEKERLVEDMLADIEEAHYQIARLNNDFQVNEQQNLNKYKLLKDNNAILEEKIQWFKMSLANQQDSNHQLQQTVQTLHSQIQNLKQLNLRTTQSSQDLLHQIQLLSLSQSTLLNQKKFLTQSLTQLESNLLIQRQLHTSVGSLLQEEEKKNLQLKEFVSLVIKQKEAVIKKELEKTERVLQLEMLVLELKRDGDINNDNTKNYQAQLEGLKSKIKQQTHINKTLQVNLTQIQTKLIKSTQKYQQKQKELLLKEQSLIRLQQQHKLLKSSTSLHTNQLHQTISSSQNSTILQQSQHKQTLRHLQSTITQLQQTLASKHHQSVMLLEKVHQLEEISSQSKRQILRQSQDIQQKVNLIKDLQANINEHQELLLQRNQQLYEFTEKIHHLQNSIQIIIRDKDINAEEAQHDWQRRFDGQVNDYQHKIQVISKQREMIRSLLDQKVAEIQLQNTNIQQSQESMKQLKHNYEQKLKKSESIRLSSLLQSSNQIKKLQQENKRLVSKQSLLDSSCQQTSVMLQSVHSRLVSQQKLRKQCIQKVKQMKKTHQQQLNTLIRRENQQKLIIQKVYQCLFSNQRQVRKVCQSWLKNVLNLCKGQQIDKITTLTTHVEDELVNAMKIGILTNE